MPRRSQGEHQRRKLAGRRSVSGVHATVYDQRRRPDRLTHGIPQYLAFINHPYLRSGGNTVPALIKAKTDNDTAIEQLYLVTISRRPSSQELTETRAFIDKSGDQAKAWNGILWMLVNRSEFMLIQ